MDLMSVTTTYKSLTGKYENFKAPSAEIKVGSKKMVAGNDISIQRLEVELSCGFEASGCVFEIINAYNPEKSDFDKSTECFQIGETIEISVGYIRRESVFKGYINSVEYSFGEDDGQYTIRVECMDAKGLLMKNRRLEFFTEKTADAVVGKVLGEAPVSNYLSGKELDKCPNEEIPFRSHMLSDYDLIVEQASKYGYEFFILQGKAYFRKRQKVSSVLMELKPGECLLEGALNISGQSLAKKVIVRSIDENTGEQIKGEAVISGNFGKSASKLLGNSTQVFYEAGVKDASEAKSRAAARVEAMAEKFGEFTCTCIGIPELAPGRFIKVSKLSSVADRKYYVQNVRHVLDEEGYVTYIKAGVNSL